MPDVAQKLEKLREDYAKLLQKAKTEIMELQAQYDTELATEDAKRKFDNMSDAEKAALEQLIKTNGIESEGKVGTPGA